MQTRTALLPRSLAAAGIIVRCAGLVVPGMAFGQMSAPPPGQDSIALAAQHHRKTLQDRLVALGASLQLTAVQAPLWQDYVQAAVRQRAIRREWAQANPRPAVLTLPQRIDRRMALSRQLQPGREQADAALKRVYAALSPAQQLTLELGMRGHGGARHHDGSEG